MLGPKKSELENKLEELSIGVTKDLGFMLYHLEYVPRSSILRLFVCHPKTLACTIEDCVKVDDALTPFLVDADWLPEEFSLEVSSPGVYRKIKTLEHFVLAQNQMIKVKVRFKDTEENSSPKSKIYRGILKEIRENGILIMADEKAGEVSFKLENVIEGNVDPDWP